MKAYPHTKYFSDIHDNDNMNGMDLRDYFAAKALQSFLTIDPNKWSEMYPDSDSMMTNVPRLAYDFADAMMKARKNERT